MRNISQNIENKTSSKAVKEEQAKDFSKSKTKLVNIVDTLHRAISIMKEMTKNLTFLQNRIDTKQQSKLINLLEVKQFCLE